MAKTAQEFLDEMLNKEIPDNLNWEQMTIIAMQKFANSKLEEAAEKVDKITSVSGCNSAVKQSILNLREEV